MTSQQHPSLDTSSPPSASAQSLVLSNSSLVQRSTLRSSLLVTGSSSPEVLPAHSSQSATAQTQEGAPVALSSNSASSTAPVHTHTAQMLPQPDPTLSHAVSAPMRQPFSPSTPIIPPFQSSAQPTTVIRKNSTALASSATSLGQRESALDNQMNSTMSSSASRDASVGCYCHERERWRCVGSL